ncbi:ALP1-like protein [Tanacetum coccineum]
MSMFMVSRECLKALIVCIRNGNIVRVAGANNDISVLDNSSLFDDLLDDITRIAPFEVNGVGFENGYYLAEGIYPQWATFVKSFEVKNDEKHGYFKRQQESARKNDNGISKILLASVDVSPLDKPHFKLENLLRRPIMNRILMKHVQYLYCEGPHGTGGVDDGVTTSFQNRHTQLPHAHTQASKTYY